MWSLDVERSLASSWGKPRRWMRYVTARLLVELTLGRQLNTREARVLYATLPRVREVEG